MLREINPVTHMVVDLSDCAEVAGAFAVDDDTGQVQVRRSTYDGDEVVTKWLVQGHRVVRRR